MVKWTAANKDDVEDASLLAQFIRQQNAATAIVPNSSCKQEMRLRPVLSLLHFIWTSFYCPRKLKYLTGQEDRIIIEFSIPFSVNLSCFPSILNS